MDFKILIAESRDILRTGLRTIFVEDKRITHIYEVTTKEDLQISLYTNSFDLVVVNQSLAPDISVLPRGRFVILTPKLDITVFQEAFKHGARGYLLENTPVEFLRTLVGFTEGTFLIEPTLTTPIIEYLASDTRFTISDDLLTPREREIINLLREGFDRHTIARQLCISEATLKTHIKNITRKRESNSPSSDLKQKIC